MTQIVDQKRVQAWWDHVFRSVEQGFKPLSFKQFSLRVCMVM